MNEKRQGEDKKRHEGGEEEEEEEQWIKKTEGRGEEVRKASDSMIKISDSAREDRRRTKDVNYNSHTNIFKLPADVQNHNQPHIRTSAALLWRLHPHVSLYKKSWE